jgi:hypothetical protein
MTFRPEEIAGLAFVSSRHRTRDLDVTIALVESVPWMSVRVCDAKGQQYVVGPTGTVWESLDGMRRDKALT